MTPEEDKAPPAGGFGAPQPFQHTKVGYRANPPKRSNTATLVVAGSILVALGALFALGMVRYNYRRPPTGEAMNTIGQIGKDLSLSYEEKGTLCPSSRPIPSDRSKLRGMKYQSTASDWAADPGWSCAKFEMTSPQYYQYRFETKGDDVTVVAVGDLNGDGVEATFELHGHADPEHHQLVLEPNIRMTNPDE